jgi:hypothetical protein
LVIFAVNVHLDCTLETVFPAEDVESVEVAEDVAEAVEEAGLVTTTGFGLTI